MLILISLILTSRLNIIVPDICSFKINELLGKGLEDEAVKEIDKTIAAYGDDGYNATETWHLQKVAILEK